MKSLKKLALVSAITAAPFAAQALETLDDEVLGEVTGQEGITIDRSYNNRIEEFTYIDSDGDGSGTAGKISLKNIAIGNYSDANLFLAPPTAYNGTTLFQMEVNGQTIDATANGVLISHGNIGFEPASSIDNKFNNIYLAPQTEQGSNHIALSVDGGGIADDLTDHGVTSSAAVLRGQADGLDINIGAIEIGNANSAQNSIGTVDILNAANFAGSAAVFTLIDKYGIAGGRAGLTASTPGSLTTAAQLFNNSSNQWLERLTLISSKASGTGVHIESENQNGIAGQAVYYTDTDGGVGGNQIGVYGMSVFRIATTDGLGDNQDIQNGTFLRPGYTEFDLDVEGGKLVMSNMIKSNSMVLNQIFIGSVMDATKPGNPGTVNAPTGIIGGIAILGNRWEGSQSIYAH